MPVRIIDCILEGLFMILCIVIGMLGALVIGL